VNKLILYNFTGDNFIELSIFFCCASKVVLSNGKFVNLRVIYTSNASVGAGNQIMVSVAMVLVKYQKDF
jgi:hypothetical protein